MVQYRSYYFELICFDLVSSPSTPGAYLYLNKADLKEMSTEQLQEKMASLNDKLTFAYRTGNGTATFTGVKWGTAGAPTITATAGKMDILTFIADGTNWYGSIAQGYTP